MSTVKWVDPNILRDKRNTIAITPVIPLADLKDVVEGLRKLINEARGFEAMSKTSTHGYTNRRVLRERIDEAQRLLAQLTLEGA